MNLKRAAIIIGSLLFITALVGGGWYYLHRTHKTAANSSNVSSNKKESNVPNPTQSFDKTRFSLSTPGSIWLVVNKKRLLPETYVPADLNVPNVPLRLAKDTEQMRLSAQAIPAMEEMVNAAKTAGRNLMLGSGYRSYAYQKRLYDGYVKSLGETEASRSSAKPGTSEHQTGLAADMEPTNKKCELDVCFGDLPEGRWLAAHASEYGFIIRYPLNKDSVTGYEYEPWHIRFVGKELANEMANTGVETLEEFFGLPAYKS